MLSIIAKTTTITKPITTVTSTGGRQLQVLRNIAIVISNNNNNNNNNSTSNQYDSLNLQYSNENNNNSNFNLIQLPVQQEKQHQQISLYSFSTLTQQSLSESQQQQQQQQQTQQTQPFVIPVVESTVSSSSERNLNNPIIDITNNASSATATATAVSNSNSNKKIRNTIADTDKKKDPIIVTDRAAIRIQELLSSPSATSINATGIRLGVKRRGCNGLSYTLNYATSTTEVTESNDTTSSTTSTETDTTSTGKKKTSRKSINNDIQVYVPYNDVIVYVDSMALFNVVGTVMDYIENDMGSEFTFTNPNSKGSCGCGESFNV